MEPIRLLLLPHVALLFKLASCILSLVAMVGCLSVALVLVLALVLVVVVVLFLSCELERLFSSKLDRRSTVT